MTSRRRDDILAASFAATRCLIDTHGRASVTELAEAAGISRRTWHRYFPAKEDLLRPLLRDATDTLLETFAARDATEDVYVAFIAAFATAAGGMFTERTRELMPIVFASPSLTAVLDSETLRTAPRLRPHLARFLDRDGDDPTVVGLATVLLALALSALRDAAGSESDPAALLAERVEALGLTQRTLPMPAGERRSS
ncbi:TetR/AcrR family transcriptional regulator [Microbacterium sp. SLBN-111]|uniref:TetR/AcrR family transcriptional regulator n=1 Tax=Microbacterium sp. SLBN-111 TaxID=3377733 RepID=UPI003C73CD01